MKIDCIYVNTYRYDYSHLRICIASIRYWYPEIPIFLIKDYTSGNFDTSVIENNWNARIFSTKRKVFGWGYGKLEPLFAEFKQSFLVLDSDTALLGPVLENAYNCDTAFLVDEEVQPIKRFNEIYYNLEKIELINKNFKYPGYSFNSGQWFGSTGYFTRTDFAPFIIWSTPPIPKYPDIVYKGDQSVLNFVMHLKEQNGQLTVRRRILMVWPAENGGDFIDLEKIKNREATYPYIMHWAGIKFNKISSYPRADIIKYYLSFYNTKLSLWQKIKEKIFISYTPVEKWLKIKFL